MMTGLLHDRSGCPVIVYRLHDSEMKANRRDRFYELSASERL